MQHILVITLSNLGDVIMTTPVIMALATRFPPGTLGRFTHHLRPVDMVLGGAVAEIQTYDIHPCVDHLFENDQIAGRGAQGGNNLGSTALRHGRLLSDL